MYIVLHLYVRDLACGSHQGISSLLLHNNVNYFCYAFRIILSQALTHYLSPIIAVASQHVGSTDLNASLCKHNAASIHNHPWEYRWHLLISPTQVVQKLVRGGVEVHERSVWQGKDAA
jgi:hypothetical protein